MEFSFSSIIASCRELRTSTRRNPTRRVTALAPRYPRCLGLGALSILTKSANTASEVQSTIFEATSAGVMAYTVRQVFLPVQPLCDYHYTCLDKIIIMSQSYNYVLLVLALTIAEVTCCFLQGVIKRLDAVTDHVKVHGDALRALVVR